MDRTAEVRLLGGASLVCLSNNEQVSVAEQSEPVETSRDEMKEVIGTEPARPSKEWKGVMCCPRIGLEWRVK